MLSNELKAKLNEAKSLEEVKEIVKDRPDLNAEHIWQELERHQSAESEKLDLEELEAVSGGADRDWQKDGCAATCEETSWCWSNDFCTIFDVTYDNFWRTCPDGHEHVYNGGDVCVRCGHSKPFQPDEHPWD